MNLLHHHYPLKLVQVLHRLRRDNPLVVLLEDRGQVKNKKMGLLLAYQMNNQATLEVEVNPPRPHLP